MYPRAAKTAERVTIQPTREMCINQLQRAFRKSAQRGREPAIALQRELMVEVDDGILFPCFEPMIAGNRHLCSLALLQRSLHW